MLRALFFILLYNPCCNFPTNGKPLENPVKELACQGQIFKIASKLNRTPFFNTKPLFKLIATPFKDFGLKEEYKHELILCQSSLSPENWAILRKSICKILSPEDLEKFNALNL